LDIVALTSFNEGTPVSLIEAQAANRPIVSTGVGGILDVVVEGKTALISPTNEIEGFSNNLFALCENDDMRINMGKNAFEFVNNKYHYRRLVDDVTRLYDSLLTAKAPE
jgi:glycosyltransferase involved in cell wall biosynthesis